MTELEAIRVLKEREKRKMLKARLTTTVASTVMLLFALVVDIIRIIDIASDTTMETSDKVLSIIMFAVIILALVLAEALNIRTIVRHVTNMYTDSKNEALDYVHRRLKQFYDSCEKTCVPDAYIEGLNTCIATIEAAKDKSNREIKEENEAIRLTREREAEQLLSDEVEQFLNDLEQASNSATDKE